jgi:H+/Cl- antiporter ClcA
MVFCKIERPTINKGRANKTRYLTLEVFPIVFEEQRGWSPVVGSLPFLGLFVGVCAAVFINLANQKRYARLLDEAHGKPVPEGRCPPMAIGGVLFAIGLFWFGWTANKHIHCKCSRFRKANPPGDTT